MPGIPQVWCLDVFAGKNNYEAADRGGDAGHKEINRTTLTIHDVEVGVKRKIVLAQLELLKLRNTSKAFLGTTRINETSHKEIDIQWINENELAHLKVILKISNFSIDYTEGGIKRVMSF